ncbi:MAG TPA: helix-turn-helix transcriptional regulator [Streptosporangiaceae bacterium]|nr:helix-turn-helix transcriptional regulator [Streptosporangiaceae bacterium]
MTTPDPAQQLAQWLKAAREAANMTTYDVAERAGITQSRASRLERGLATATPELVRAWAEATGTEASRVEALVSEARRGTHQLRGNATVHGPGLMKRQRDMGEIRQAMTSFSEFSLAAIPGLLQVPGYATAIMERLSRISSMPGVAAAVSQRMNNQSILYDPARTFSFVISESALHYQAGPPAVMRAQAEKISSVVTLPNVSIAVLPFTASQSLIIQSSFAIYEIPDEPLVLVELLAGEAIFTSIPDIQLYRDAFAEILNTAVTDRDAAQLITSAMHG